MPAMPACSKPWNTATFSAHAIRRAASSSAVEVDVRRAPVGVAELVPRDA